MRQHAASPAKIACMQASQIEVANHRKASPLFGLSFHCHMCKCLVPGCGDVMEQLTFAHAAEHGYPTKQAMIDAGMVWFFQQDKRRIQGYEK